LFGEWGKETTEEELRSAAEDLLAESDDGRLLKYLRIFRRRRFPGRLDRLLELIRTGERRVAYAVTNVLVRVGGVETRATALGLLDQPQRLGMAVELLAACSEPGDYQVLESLLKRPLTDFDYHALGIGARAFVKANPQPEAARSLTLIYENGPCSMCRCDCVRSLLACECLPEWMRQECRYDAVVDTRKMVKGLEVSV
jgi:hypothetical protein